MAGKKGGENSKKAAGNAKKAEAAAQKQAAADSVKAREEDSKWSKGAKDTSKKEASANKAAEAAAKKAEKAALLAAEEASLPSKPKGNAKSATKKTSAAPSRGTLNLSQLDDEPPTSKKASDLNATGIDSALDALSLTTNGNELKIDRHPERRFKAAYAAFEARRLPELEQENPGLRRNQRVELCRKEFEKSDENPFNNSLAGRFDMSKEELAAFKKAERERIEKNLK
ncbi:hypothetical protein UCRPC4_g03050 [Phaeomoniella chlamydospora]|uniref:Duf1014 domain protein n=1 Tax=Phaeomoniella chlamydospora TaxID=158046 RepID=A0A0G2H253_PHACM|nr:hypothetical protein UCRPC4_g03050 [Phaeomoniella chlamydospora]